MARGTNPARCAARRALTREPASLARRGIPHRNAFIETPTGQQVLQSTLFQIFAYPRTEHPWNPRGRTLTQLFDCYGTWVSPQPDRVVFGATLATRMAGYLLPYVNRRRSGAACLGIPGLRFLRPTRHGYELVHLPTDTVMEIRDGRQGRVASLEHEIDVNREDDGNEPVWRQSELTEVERQWDNIWRPTPHTGLYSAWYNAIPLFDGSAGSLPTSHLTLHTASSDIGRAHLSWCGELAPERAVAYLQALGVGVDGEPLSITALVDGFAIVSVGDTAMELHQRSACADCSGSHLRWQGHLPSDNRRRRHTSRSDSRPTAAVPS